MKTRHLWCDYKLKILKIKKFVFTTELLNLGSLRIAHNHYTTDTPGQCCWRSSIIQYVRRISSHVHCSANGYTRCQYEFTQNMHIQNMHYSPIHKYTYDKNVSGYLGNLWSEVLCTPDASSWLSCQRHQSSKGNLLTKIRRNIDNLM